MAQESVPCLPMEILEEIVGFHGEKLEDGRPSATLLACLATSRQFRACALRYLCADAPVYLDRPNQLKRLRDCMISAEFNHHMKSVAIVFSSTPYLEAPCLNEKNILPLLEILIRQPTLRALTFQGRSWLWGHEIGDLPWTQLPPKTRLLLRSLAQVPTVTRLSFRWYRDVPPEVFSQHPYQAITFADGYTSGPGPVTELNTTYLTLETARFRGISLPNLRHIKTRCHFDAYYHPTWDVIKQCRNTLETIQVREDAPVIPIRIPQDVQLHMFPRLEEFNHSLHTSMSTLDVHPVLSKFFPPAQTSSVISNLKKLRINIRIIDYGNLAHSNNDPWIERLTSVASNPIWVDLDNILAKGLYFTALQRVSIHLRYMKRNPDFFATLDNDHLAGSLVDTDALREKLLGALAETFSASIRASVPLKIFVDLDVRS